MSINYGLHIKKEGKEYIEQQIVFIGAVIEEIKRYLEEVGLDGDELRDETEDLSLRISTIIDNTSTSEFKGKEVFPLLTFIKGDNELIHCGGNSYTHEYVNRLLDDIFKS